MAERIAIVKDADANVLPFHLVTSCNDSVLIYADNVGDTEYTLTGETVKGALQSEINKELKDAIASITGGQSTLTITSKTVTNVTTEDDPYAIVVGVTTENGSVKTVTVDASEITNTISTLETDVTSEITAVSSKIDVEITKVTSIINAEITAVNSTITEKITEVNSSITEVDGKVTELSGTVSTLTESVATELTTVYSEIKVNTDTISDIKEEIGTKAVAATGDTEAQPSTGIYKYIDDKSKSGDDALKALDLRWNASTKKLGIYTSDAADATLIDEIDGSSFVVDGMVESVVQEGNNVTITWNTAAGKEAVVLDFAQYLDNVDDQKSNEVELSESITVTGVEATASGTTVQDALEYLAAAIDESITDTDSKITATSSALTATNSTLTATVSTLTATVSTLATDTTSKFGAVTDTISTLTATVSDIQENTVQTIGGKSGVITLTNTTAVTDNSVTIGLTIADDKAVSVTYQNVASKADILTVTSAVTTAITEVNSKITVLDTKISTAISEIIGGNAETLTLTFTAGPAEDSPKLLSSISDPTVVKALEVLEQAVADADAKAVAAGSAVVVTDGTDTSGHIQVSKTTEGNTNTYSIAGLDIASASELASVKVGIGADADEAPFGEAEDINYFLDSDSIVAAIKKLDAQLKATDDKFNWIEITTAPPTQDDEPVADEGL